MLPLSIPCSSLAASALLVAAAWPSVPVAASVAQQTKPAVAAADSATLHKRFNLMGESLGLAGFDPVAYFEEGGGHAQRGLIRLSAEHEGVTFRFASEQHRQLFQKNPERYLPAYGGWCAWAVGELGKRVDIDPQSFEVRGGRLFVFYRDAELDTRLLWLKNAAELTAKAEANYPALASGK